MTSRARPAVALLLVALTGTMLWWPAGVAAAVPVAVDDSGLVVQKNAAATPLDVLANDTHDPLTSGITAATDPAHGTVVIDGDGQGLAYQPDAAYTGTDTFDYTLHDDADGDSTGTVTVKINAPPVAFDDPRAPGCNQHPTDFGGTFPVPEDYGQFVLFGGCGLRANDTDSDGTVVDWEVVTPPSHGVLQYIDADFFAYTPTADYSTIAGNLPGGQWVSDNFTYRSKDNDGAWSQPATMRYWVAPVNDTPTFVSPPSQVEVAEDSGAYDTSWAPYASAGPSNESDQTVDFVITQVDSYGLVNMFSVPPDFTSGGHLTFTAGPNECGFATVTVHLHDDGGLENYGINNLPDPPDDTSDSITFDIVVDCANDAPVAADDTATVAEDSGANVIAVRGNDTDPDFGATLTVTGKTDGSKGTVTITGGGTGVSYTPNANAIGSDSFTYTLSDGTLTDTGTVNVTISSVNDPPSAADDTTTVAEDAAATAIAVLSNDSIAPDTGETLTITATSTSSHGTVVITGGGMGLTYQPGANYNGSDSFTYTISDGTLTDTATVNVTISSVNDAPDAVNDGLTVLEDAEGTTVLVRSNDTDVDGDTLAVTSKTNGAKGSVVISGTTAVTYTPNPNATGADAFMYTVSDGHGGTDTATVNVTIIAVNDDPVATNDAVTVVEDQAAAATVGVLANDSDVDGDTSTVTGKTNGAKGAVVIVSGGTAVTYKPNANAFGSDMFTYSISDGHGGSATAAVNVTITPVNDAPNAVNDGLGPTIKIGTGSGPVPIDVLANDTSSPDGREILRITAVTQGSNGSVAIIDRGTRLTYDPAGTTNGIAAFQYTISDGHGGTDTGTVQVTVGTDATGPVVGVPVVTATRLMRVGTTRLVVSWIASDPESGIASSRLQLKRDGAATWKTVPLADPIATRTIMLVATGHTYQFQVMATSGVGQTSTFKVGALVTV